MEKVYAIGVMSGSSLDGLDLSLCAYSQKDEVWEFELLKSMAVPFPKKLENSLTRCRDLSALEITELDHELGRWIGEQCLELSGNEFEGAIIGSHGHTVFHNPAAGYTLQIGNGNAIASSSGMETICDFRSQDIQNGGQGAPLAPIGDLHLFRKYEVCFNLGGIVNVSIKDENKIIAWDVCPLNQVLNFLSAKLGKPYDEGGKIAKSGQFVSSFYNQLSTPMFYNLAPPKAMSNEWVYENVIKEIPEKNPEDLMQTFTQFVADKMSESISKISKGKVLLTGGGAKNDYLVEILKSKLSGFEIIRPTNDIIDFKEAIVFGLMAVLRKQNKPNVLSSVTGTKRDLSSGIIYYP